jgi:hypothetical protein
MSSDLLNTALGRLESEFRRAAGPREVHQASSPDSPRARLERRVAREPVLREAIDAACRQWAQGEAWPISDPETSVFIWDRIVEARIFGEWLSRRVDLAPCGLLEIGRVLSLACPALGRTKTPGLMPKTPTLRARP